MTRPVMAARDPRGGCEGTRAWGGRDQCRLGGQHVVQRRTQGLHLVGDRGAGVVPVMRGGVNIPFGGVSWQSEHWRPIWHW